MLVIVVALQRLAVTQLRILAELEAMEEAFGEAFVPPRVYERYRRLQLAAQLLHVALAWQLRAGLVGHLLAD